MITPTTLGIIDYISLVVVAAMLFTAADRVYQLTAAKWVFFIQIPVIFLLFMVLIDGFGAYIGFWFESFGEFTRVLNMLELSALIAWTPWGDVIEGIRRAASNMGFNSRQFVILNKRHSSSLD